MNIHLISVGNRMPRWVVEGYTEYARRLPPECALQLVEVPPGRRGKGANIPRILPKDCNAVIKKASWPMPKIFPFLQKAGPVKEAEMFRVFNMGIGYVLVVSPDFADSIARNLQRWGEKVNRIGTITRGSGKVVLKK